MDLRTGWIIGLSAAALLAACDKPSDKPAGAEAAKPAVAANPVSLTAPKRKAGLWEQQMTTQGMQQTASLCVDPASEGEMAAFGQQMAKEIKCTQQAFNRRLDGALEFQSTCPMGDSGTVSSKGVVTGDFNSSYKMEMTSTTTGARVEHMNGARQMTLVATWKGPCPADMKPGDIRIAGMPGGMTFNPTEMAKQGAMPNAAQMAELRKRAEAMRKTAE